MRFGTILIVYLLLIPVLCYFPAHQAAALPAPETRSVLTSDQARMLAQAWVERKQALIPEWHGAVADTPVLYNDLQLRPVVYVVPVTHDRLRVGYIIVSYEAIEHPILVFSANIPPHERCNACIDPQHLAQQGFRLAAQPYIYGGPLEFFYRLEVPDSTQMPASLQNTAEIWVMPMDGTAPMAVATPAPATVSVDTIVADLPAFPAAAPASTATAKMIFGVPDYDQFLVSSCYSGCTPTSAGNIVHFWNNAGFSGLANASASDTIIQLRDLMDTFCKGIGGATYTSKASSGLEKYARLHGYKFSSKQYCPSGGYTGCNGNASWNLYAAQIDQSHPVLISFDSKFYGSHSVAGVGYDVDVSKYWIVHDNWPTTTRDVFVQTNSASDVFYHTFIPPAQDTLAPSVAIAAPAYFRKNTPIPLTWSGEDNFSGVARYDVQYYNTQADAWQDWLLSTTQTGGMLAGRNDDRLQVRARSYDWMGNVSDWSTAESLLYAYTITGSLTGNRGYAPAGGQAVGVVPELADNAYPDHVGNFTLYVKESATLDLVAGTLPPLQDVVVDRDLSGYRLVLRPPQEFMLNGHFEQGLQSWTSGGPITPTLAAGNGHTGNNAVQFVIPGGSVPGAVPTGTLSQTLVLPDSVERPTLSWLSMVGTLPVTEQYMLVTIRGSAGDVLTTTVALSDTVWAHHWLDLAPLAGQTIVVIFEVQQAASGDPIILLLDEISVGEGQIRPRTVALPLVVRSR